MDLIVWLNDESGGEIAAFQLCYDKTRGEKALYWKAGRGFAHLDVDDGESAAGKYKGSPLLTPDGAFDSAAVLQGFAAAAQALPDNIRDFVETRLAQASGHASSSE